MKNDTQLQIRKTLKKMDRENLMNLRPKSGNTGKMAEANFFNSKSKANTPRQET